FDILRDIKGAPVEIDIWGMPGTSTNIQLLDHAREFRSATIDGEPVKDLSSLVNVKFPGKILKEESHRRLASLEPVDLPDDIKAMYEAVAFAADNSCLEARCMKNNGNTNIPQVKACREAFFNQPILRARGCWDRYAFDGDDSTIWNLKRDTWNCLRVDFGSVQEFDRILLVASGQSLDAPIKAYVSVDLKSWHIISEIKIHEVPDVDCQDLHERFPRNLDERFKGEPRVPAPPGKPKRVEFMTGNAPARYFIMEGTPDDVFEINAMVGGAWRTPEERESWHGTFMFENSKDIEFCQAWSTTITLNELPAGSKLCVACEGRHDAEGVYAVLRVNGSLVGAPERAPAYMGHPWEHLIQNSQENYTYYFPIKEAWLNQPIEVICFGTEYYNGDCHPDVWVTTWPDAFVHKKLILI
ncbi:MAG: discoidin domain-containing protein, partial [Promethearchaeota archaeon]